MDTADQNDASTQTSNSIGGRYLLEQKLGASGMGIVYRATDRLTQETIALKQVIIASQDSQVTVQASFENS